MARIPVEEILDALAKALNAMPDVFSTAQWGGRAYKLPGPGSRGTTKPVLLTHISVSKDRGSVRLGFRLHMTRAKSVVKQHEFIKPSTFGTLGKSGWLETKLTTQAHCRVVIGLLKESRALHPVSDTAATNDSKASGNRKRGKTAEAGTDAKRIDAIMRRKHEEGWSPRDDDFDS